ncbi:MAG: type IX secretion system outer membrane channel protein PorV [Marinilabiliales bacterium]|nr:type IX secretion system outer membrane channel protein PorV [Marinilabiliales bacterium]
MSRRANLSLILVLISLAFVHTSYSQSLATGQEVQYNPITTAVPFLTITPDSRHGAMGDAGVATSPDANAQYWNPSKFAFVKDNFGFALSYTPWLRQLVNDINLAYVSGYYKIDQMQTIGASLRYFSMGEILLTDMNGSSLANVSPNEFAFDVSYSRKLSESLSGGVAIRYIRSDLSGGIGPESYVPGHTFATDVSFFYTHNFGITGNDQNISAGINLSNIGGKISYDDGQNKEFLPANLRLGTTYTREMDGNNSIALSLDFNKLMVPSPQVSSSTTSGSGSIVLPDNSNNASVVSSIFSSFTDAPGGMKEELREINYSIGAEYWYNHQFAVRAGYFHESEYKGNRKFLSAGLGLKMNICSIDFSYLIPVQQNNPLANTVRFTLIFDLKSFNKGKM